MEKNRIVKSWELKATSQKSFYKKAYAVLLMESLSADNDPVSYYDHKDANMGNKYYGIPFGCRW